MCKQHALRITWTIARSIAFLDFRVLRWKLTYDWKCVNTTYRVPLFMPTACFPEGPSPPFTFCSFWRRRQRLEAVEEWGNHVEYRTWYEINMVFCLQNWHHILQKGNWRNIAFPFFPRLFRLGNPDIWIPGRLIGCWFFTKARLNHSYSTVDGLKILTLVA